MSRNESTENLQARLAECDGLIKAGKIAAVASLIGDLNFARVPRSLRVQFAKICRRVGLIDSGLRLLHPVILDQRLMVGAATPAEICEYAVLLSRDGSIPEALALLAEVDPRLAPEALLYQAFCHISNWGYAQAAGFLERYLESDVDSYSKLVARVNLVSALLALGRLEEAEPLLAETIDLARESNAWRLLGNLLEMRGNFHLQKGAYAKSREDLEQALKVFESNEQGIDELVILKWLSFIEASETGETGSLSEFRMKALQRGHWESVRDADLLLVKTKFEQKTFDHLIFGTPNESYRRRILEQVPREPSRSFDIGTLEGIWLDLASGEMHGKGEINAGKKIHQMILCLTRDFYAPRNVGALFSELYPDEFFDVDSSPVRIRQIITRARRWLETQGIEAGILHDSGRYSFSIQGKFGIKVPLDRPRLESVPIKWLELRDRFPTGTPFTTEEACRILDLHRSSFQRLAAWAQENDLLKKTGNSRGTFYELIEREGPKIKKAAG